MSQGFSKIQKNIRLGIIMTLGIFISGTLFPTSASATTYTDKTCEDAGPGWMCSYTPLPDMTEKGDCGPAKKCYAPNGDSGGGYTDEQCKAKNPSASCLSGTCSGTNYGSCVSKGKSCCLPSGISLSEAECNAKNPKGECKAKSPGEGYVNLGRCVDKAGTNCWQKPGDGSGFISENDCKARNGACVATKPGNGYIDLGLCKDKPSTHCWQTPASGGNCPSQGGECKSDKICTGNKLVTSDCGGPTQDGGSLVCCVPSSGGGDGPGGSTETISFPNPLKFDTFQDFVMGVLAYLQGIIVLLAVVFIVIGGVLYLISGGNEGWIKTAKSAITAAMIGLAIGIGAPTFLREIVTILCTTGDGGSILCPIDQAPIAGAISLWQILLNTLNFLLGITGILAVIMFVIGGGMYLTSAGVDNRIDTGKDIIKNSLIGIIIVLAALIIVKQIATLFV